jgi:hypothetical protein
MEHEGFSMVYALQNFRHYLFGHPFEFFIDHLELKYLVNELVIEGWIFHWLLLFQEFEFDMVMNLVKHNIKSDHVSQV